MALQIQSSDRQAVVSAFGKGDSGFRFIRILSSDGINVRFSVGQKIFTALCGEKLQTGMLYRVRLMNDGGKLRLMFYGDPVSDNLPPAVQSAAGRSVMQARSSKARQTLSDIKKAAAEFGGNRLDSPESRLEAFYTDLFSCRFEKQDFAEQLELFNACGTPPRFRSVIPFEWNGIRGYLDLMIAGNRLVSYRFRILSGHFDALIHSDPVFRKMTVDTFGEIPLLPEELQRFQSLSEYRIRSGENIPSALAYADENPYREVDEWM